MLCPHCQIELSTINLKDTNVDICPSCYGVWLDKGELQKLIETDKNELKLSPIGEANMGCNNDVVACKITDFALQRKEKLWESEIACPRCRKLMQKSHYAVTSDIFIDSCLKGCGVWLDKGEILRIADYLVTAEKPLSNIQKEQVKERLRMFAEANKEKVTPWEFLNKRYYSMNEIDFDSNPAGKYLAIVYSIIQGIIYFLSRKIEY